MKTIFWVARMTSRHYSRRDGIVHEHWQREAGWDTREAAERSAAFYRREYGRPAEVEEVRAA